MQHLGTVTIETERLVLRRFVPEDAPYAYRNWCSRDDVTRFLRWPTHTSVEVTEKVIGDWIENYGDPAYYNWVIVFKEIGEPVGNISVVERDDRCELVEIGYCLGDRWWHKGIMSEALSAVIAFFFRSVGINRVEARHDANNPHSGQVMQKCGMKLEGVLRKSDWNNQGVADMCIYGLLREEYNG
ncbi:MAG: GNAT family N-acetyltransferase [Oscillospiraceae bacterium]|nr:GNAT family N-acetyltransferase [Oscillospiraceae bacterium]